MIRSFSVILALAALGIAAILFGDADDAPGAMLLGVLLIVGALVLGVRKARRGG